MFLAPSLSFLVLLMLFTPESLNIYLIVANQMIGLMVFDVVRRFFAPFTCIRLSTSLPPIEAMKIFNCSFNLRLMIVIPIMSFVMCCFSLSN